MKTLLCALLLFSSSFYLAANTRNKTIAAQRATSTISIDGHLNESDWSDAESISDFLQYDPDEGLPPTERTVVMVLYDDHSLYIGAVLFDSDPSGIKGQLSRRDRYTHADRFEILIDSNNDKQTAYHFAVNVSEVQQDGIYSHDGARYDVNWDAVWESSTAILRRGWSVEIRIPLSSIRFDRMDGEYRWGINFRRFIARKNEELHWVMVPRAEPGLVSRFGTLRGINDIARPLHVEVLPYIVSKGWYQSSSLPQISENNLTGNAGVDLKLGLTTNTTLDVAINPDFGQVEIDQAIINLTAFETFYAEKRPFFIEGSDLFRFGSTYDGRHLRLFYSRRVGRRPLQPWIGENESFVELPQVTTLLGAAKLIGRTPKGLSFGALSAITAQEEAVVRIASGDKREIIVQPRGAYNAFRIKQDVLSSSSVGMMMTAVARDEWRPAITGGVDWNLRLFDNTYSFDGFVTASRTERNNEMLEGTAGRFYFARPSGKNWLGSINYEFFSPEYNINDGGYNQRTDYRGGWFDVYYKDDFASRPFRRYRLRWAAESLWNYAGYNIKKDTQVTLYGLFTNFYSGLISYEYNFSSYDDVETRGEGLYRRPVFHKIESWLSTDLRRSIIAYPVFTYLWNEFGWREFYFVFDFDVRPTPYIEISPAIGFLRSKRYEAWITNVDDNSLGVISLFADRDIDQVDLSFRGIITLRPNLSVQFFTQVLISRVWYNDIRRLDSPEAFAEYPEFNPANPSYFNPDFNRQIFNANIVLRWEYTRGSTLFLIWTQNRDDYHSRIHQPFGDTFKDTFRTPMNNILMAKFTYWFSV
jgi:hypothetical protein